LGILEPEIEELEKRYEDFSSSKIFLFGTKQEPLNCQDTIYAAEIAKRKIISRFNLNKEEVEISIGGRHDISAIPRIVPVVEAMVRIVLADHLLRQLANLAFQKRLKFPEFFDLS